MSKKLWFIKDNETLLEVFSDRLAAEEEKEYLEEEEEEGDFSLYSIAVSDLEDYPDEYEMALEEGYLSE